MRPLTPAFGIVPHRRWSWVATAFALTSWATGCTTHSVPDPKAAADEYARAADRGDADAIYAMMTSTAQKSRSKDDVRRLVDEQRVELKEQAKQVTGRDARIEATARLRYEDGEEAQLELRDGRFWITSSGSLPGGSRTPEQALDQLRRVLARRSYAGLMRVLTPQTRAAVEQDLRSLVEGLERPETLRVQVTGDSATVIVPGGHTVKLKREGGVWRVDDFD
ncbi:hypothetical protein [Labilithrix luteola]|uniref:hypothetical protein n=1 Tax=Labilithrix luteola TaxID=1391654 RepID=UPI001F0B0E64|nr:hypothetical protein [Labilithrix luteola]